MTARRRFGRKGELVESTGHCEHRPIGVQPVNGAIGVQPTCRKVAMRTARPFPSASGAGLPAPRFGDLSTFSALMVLALITVILSGCDPAPPSPRSITAAVTAGTIDPSAQEFVKGTVSPHDFSPSVVVQSRVGGGPWKDLTSKGVNTRTGSYQVSVDLRTPGYHSLRVLSRDRTVISKVTRVKVWEKVAIVDWFRTRDITSGTPWERWGAIVGSKSFPDSLVTDTQWCNKHDVVEWRLDSQFARFEATVGFDSRYGLPGDWGNVNVYLDDKLVASGTEVFTYLHGEHLDLAVSGVYSLRIELTVLCMSPPGYTTLVIGTPTVRR